ncbi:MAG: hypothetical protein M3299_06620 [Thermoproteota archaeon]|nr:hypothetical protein [Thermoproteota archaeon]
MWGEFVPTVDDSAIAVAAIFLLFVLPSSSRFRKEETRVKRKGQIEEDQENIIENTSRIDIGSSKTDEKADNENKERRQTVE